MMDIPAALVVRLDDMVMFQKGLEVQEENCFLCQGPEPSKEEGYAVTIPQLYCKP